MVVLSLWNFRSQCDIIHRQDHLQKTKNLTESLVRKRAVSGFYLLLEIKETILVFVEVAEHVETICLANVVHHVIL